MHVTHELYDFKSLNVNLQALFSTYMNEVFYEIKKVSIYDV